MRRVASGFALAIFVTLAGATARGDTILLFEDTNGLWLSTPSGYGNRVTATSQGGFHYGGTANTPNVVLAYGANTYGWPTQYGDLNNVIYTADFSGVLQATLTADPGYQVVLQSFDLAG
jgi:hypothetical protein